jgi:hypothetical protein
MASPDIDLMLTCSTCHVTDDDNMALCKFAREHAEAPDTSDHFVADMGYGYVVWVNSDGDFSEYNGELSDAFVALMEFAHRQGVQFLRLDRDAQELDGFPTFDW